VEERLHQTHHSNGSTRTNGWLLYLLAAAAAVTTPTTAIKEYKQLTLQAIEESPENVENLSFIFPSCSKPHYDWSLWLLSILMWSSFEPLPNDVPSPCVVVIFVITRGEIKEEEELVELVVMVMMMMIVMMSPHPML